MAVNRRRKILAHKDMQIRIVFQILTMVASGMLLTGGSVYMLIWRGITSQEFSSGQLSIINIFDNVHKTLFIVVPLLVIIMGWIAIIISHRIAGPLVRLNNGMKSLEKGEWPDRPMKFRKGDEGHHLAEQFNLMAGKLRQMINVEQETIKTMMADMESYFQKLKQEQKADREMIDKLDQIQNKFKKITDKGFTLIELMIVVVIVGVLAAIAVPNYMSMRARALEASVKSNMHTLQLVVEDYSTRVGGFYPADMTVRIVDIDPSMNIPKSITEGVYKPPFPPNSLICPYMGYANPFNRDDDALAYLNNENQIGGTPGIVYFTTYDTSGAIIGDGNGIIANTYKIRGYGKDRILSLEIRPGQSL